MTNQQQWRVMIETARQRLRAAIAEQEPLLAIQDKVLAIRSDFYEVHLLDYYRSQLGGPSAWRDKWLPLQNRINDILYQIKAMQRAKLMWKNPIIWKLANG